MSVRATWETVRGWWRWRDDHNGEVEVRLKLRETREVCGLRSRGLGLFVDGPCRIDAFIVI